MTTVAGCNIPEDLYYLIEKHVWARPEGDVVIVGLTDVAQNLAKGIISVTTKKVGKSLAKGKSIGTVESSKWVGPGPAPVSGEIFEGTPGLGADLGGRRPQRRLRPAIAGDLGHGGGRSARELRAARRADDDAFWSDRRRQCVFCDVHHREGAAGKRRGPLARNGFRRAGWHVF